MWFEQMIRKETGCVTYLIGSTATGACAVFDPLWEITPYAQLAQQHNAKVRYVIDSHSHADHVSGARRLAQMAGAELILPALADITYPATLVRDGDKLHMGEVTLEFMHTPGHRAELMSLLITDHSRSERPWCILTADSLLVGDLGRPDLAQDGLAGARLFFEQTLPRLRALADYVEVYPGHVVGSTCGRVTSGKASSTIGFERRFNRLMQMADRDLFALLMNANQPARPANMRNIVEINQGKRPFTLDTPAVPGLQLHELTKRIAAGALVLDVRTSAQFAAGHLPGAYHVPLENANFEQWVGWIIPPGSHLLLVAEHDADIQPALHKLAFLGLAGAVKGYLQGGVNAFAEDNLALRKVMPITVQQLHQRITSLNGDQPHLRVLDVREEVEWEEGHLAQAQHMNFKHLRERMNELNLSPTDRIAVICRSGTRSTIASSILFHHGYPHLYNVSGGMLAWHSAGLPVACPTPNKNLMENFL